MSSSCCLSNIFGKAWRVIFSLETEIRLDIILSEEKSVKILTLFESLILKLTIPTWGTSWQSPKPRVAHPSLQGDSSQSYKEIPSGLSVFIFSLNDRRHPPKHPCKTENFKSLFYLHPIVFFLPAETEPSKESLGTLSTFLKACL